MKVARIAMSKNTIYTNIIFMVLHESRDELTHREFGQVVYLLCCTFCIFLGTIKDRTSLIKLHYMSDLREENLFSWLFSLPCSCQDTESSCYEAPIVTSSPGVHKLMWFPSTTLSAEGGRPPVMGGKLRAAKAAAMIVAAACDPAGSVLFEYWFATSYRLGLCCVC
jgi:hypothetical protein